jgi:hypothetical protein
VDDRQGSREVGEKDDCRPQRRDEDRLAPVIVGADLAAQLIDASPKVLGREVDLANARVEL